MTQTQTVDTAEFGTDAQIAEQVAESKRREDWLNGLKSVVDFFETHPELIPHRGLKAEDYSCGSPEWERERAREWLAALGHLDKEYGDSLVTFKAREGRFGPHAVSYVAMRSSVCERKVTTVEKEVEVPDPDALAKVPTITQTVTEEIVEWDCEPLGSEVGS